MASGLPIHNLLNAQDSPSRLSSSESPQTRQPVSPLQRKRLPSLTLAQQSALPVLSQPLNSFRESAEFSNSGTFFIDSRRSSVDSRIRTGMSGLAIGPPSPYENHSGNASQTSLVSTLQQQRGIQSPVRTNGVDSLSPLGNRSRNHISVRRVAPPIAPNPRSGSGMPDPNAPAPVKGYAWAGPFGDPIEEHRRDSSESTGPPLSRANSHAPSFNSSIYTVESTLPPGQRRFEDGTRSRSTCRPTPR